MSLRTLTFYFLILLFHSYKSLGDDEMLNFDSENRPKPDDTEFFYVPIFLTSDIHGGYFWSDINVEGTKYKNGGLDYLANYLSILREEFGEKRVLYFDAGDSFQGNIESKSTNGSVITDFFNKMKCDASTFGNHEFDFGRDYLNRIINDANYPYLAANLFDPQSKSQKINPKQEFYKIFEIPTGDSKKPVLKIGVFGLSNQLDYASSNGYFDDVTFYDYVSKTIEYAKIVKEKNVDSVLLLTHAGLKCHNQQMTYGLYTKETIQDMDCEREVVEMMKNIPEGTVDAILTGHSHYENHVWMNGTPILSGTSYGLHSNVLYLPFDRKTFKLSRENITLEGPLPSCEKVFTNLKHCNSLTEAQLTEAGELTNYKYHGKLVVKEPLLQNISDTYYPIVEKYRNDVVTTIAGDKVTIDTSGNSLAGNIVCDSIRKITGADVSIMTKGDFRSTWIPGDLTAEKIISMNPYDNLIVTFEMTGRELIDTLKILQSGDKSFYPTSGLIQLVDEYPSHKLISAKLFDGHNEYPIIDDQIYTIATVDYLIKTGGDDFSKIITWFKPRNLKSFSIIGDEIIDYLRNAEIIYTTMYRDLEHPRIRYINKVE